MPRSVATLLVGLLLVPALTASAQNWPDWRGPNHDGTAEATGLPTDATETTAIVTPITAACSACHDSSPEIDHMQAMGGRFYDTRKNALAAGAGKEQCMICHGPGTIAAIATVHK